MKYTNPILKGDYSDPDVIRVGEDFYMISSSFTYIPGIPVLTSKNLVTWKLVGYAAPSLPSPKYDIPAHKMGTWAPSIRYHNGLFYVYVCLPDEGLFAFTASSPEGPWVRHLVKDVCGWIDPCPLFDENGRAYLVHALAASRAGINNLLFVHEMSPDGLSILDKGTLVFNGADYADKTTEGPKMYKRGEYYYIMCPAGGVTDGYQLCLRAKNPLGPYERRVVLSQGQTDVNGPHQGGWVDTGKGQDYFIHFQDKGAYGRVTHLQPLEWKDGWPEMGHHSQPVSEYETPFDEDTAYPPMTMSDDFLNGMTLEWQWQANPKTVWRQFLNPGLRLFAYPAASLFEAGQFLSRLNAYYSYDMDVKVRLLAEGSERAGCGMMGYRYAYIALEKGKICVYSGKALEESRHHSPAAQEIEIAQAQYESDTVVFRMSVRTGTYRFFYGESIDRLAAIGDEYEMTPGGWTGARSGIFAFHPHSPSSGFADFEYVHVTNRE